MMNNLPLRNRKHCYFFRKKDLIFRGFKSTNENPVYLIAIRVGNECKYFKHLDKNYVF
jgi:hypothetical protein